jgi:hypothetical protein
MSKGSNRRPSDVPDHVVKDEWDRIFGMKVVTVPTDSDGILMIDNNGNYAFHRDGQITSGNLKTVKDSDSE